MSDISLNSQELVTKLLEKVPHSTLLQILHEYEKNQPSQSISQPESDHAEYISADGGHDIELTKENERNENTTTIEAPSMSKTNENEELCYPTDINSAFQDWNWRKEGGSKRLVSGKCRQRYICSQKGKTGCNARIYVDTDPFNKKEVVATGFHNHKKPEKIKIDADTRAQLKEQLKTGVKISKLHTQWINNHPNSTVTKKQLQNMRSYEARKFFFSADSWINLQLMFPSFVRKLELIPSKFIILVADEALSILKERTYFMFLDGTFKLTQYNMTITTVLYQVDQIGMPVAWLIHEDKSEETYITFLQYLQKLTKNQMRPAAIFGDFEKALRNAVEYAMPHVLYFGDYWHFLHDNALWMNKNGGHFYIKPLMAQLRILYQSENFITFQQNYALFATFWQQQFSAYAVYFEKEWIKATGPSIWASFGRPKGLPTGDNVLEGWHNRIKQQTNYLHLSTDRVVKLLQDEFKYWYAVLNSPVLKAARQKEIEEMKKKWHQKLSLKKLLEEHALKIQEIINEDDLEEDFQIQDSIQNSVQDSIQDSIQDSAQDLVQDSRQDSVQNPVQDSIQNLKEEISQSLSSPIASKQSIQLPLQQPLLQTSIKPSISYDKAESLQLKFISHTNSTLNSKVPICGSCKRNRGNKSCILSLCQNCCERDVRYCQVTTHRLGKIQSQKMDIVNDISKAINDKSMVWINYQQGSKPGSVRPVQIVRWIQKPLSFGGHCHCSSCLENGDIDIEKKYLVSRVLKLKFCAFD